MTYKHLIFGKYNSKQVHEAVYNPLWQSFRESLKGLNTSEKLKQLEGWVKKYHRAEKVKIQVTNYVYALKRSGLIK